MRVKVDYTDGCYALVQYTIDRDYNEPGYFDIPDHLWAAYIGHLDHCVVWQGIIRALDDENQ